MNPCRGRPLDALAALLAHRLQRSYTTLVAAFPCLDAPAYPGFFLGQYLVEESIGAVLFGIRLAFLAQVRAVAARPGSQNTPVDGDNARCKALNESPVMGHEQYRTVISANFLFQPLDRAEIQMVGRFVQQQQFGPPDQRLRQGDSSAPATRQFAHPLGRGQLELRNDGVHLDVCRPAAAGLYRRLQGFEFAQLGLSGRQIGGKGVKGFDSGALRVHAIGHDIAHVSLGRLVERLAQHGKAHLRGLLNPAFVRLDFSGQEFESG